MNQPDDAPEGTPATKGNSGWRVAWDWGKAFLIAIVIAFGIKHFLFTQRIVSGHSMDHTLANGDRMLIDRIPYDFGLPKRGDIVVFEAPDGEQWVKRVIGLPGDTVQLIKGKLYLNGKYIPEPFITDGPSDPKYNYGPSVVPPGHLFVMGDNRVVSYDSRYIGPIAVDKLTGRVDAVIWPPDEFHIFGTTQEHYFPQGEYIHGHYVQKPPY
ncbi:MAG: signal peptidase I [Firmicutes bacterium]|nr:signal peptidase I [Bacillota bacterium]